MYDDDEPIPTATTDPGGTPLALSKPDANDNWYLIDRRDHDGREWWEPVEYGRKFCCAHRLVSDADVEGTAADMLGIANAIERRGQYHAKRCAVQVCGDLVEVYRPRGNYRRGVVTLADADALAAEIRATLK